MSLQQYIHDALDKLPKKNPSEKVESLSRLLMCFASKFQQLQLVSQHATALKSLITKASKENIPDISAIPSLHGAHFFFANLAGVQLRNHDCLEPRIVVGHKLAKGALAAATGRLPNRHGVPLLRTILLFGPSGVGKSLLLRVLEANVSSSWHCLRLDIRTLLADKTYLDLVFFSAMCHAPTVLLLDDVHKTVACYNTFTYLADKLKLLRTQTLENIDNVSFIATCEKPWDLPDELLDQFETRIFMPLPCPIERLVILKLHLPKSAPITLEQMIDLANEMEGFSGANISDMVRRAAMFERDELVELSQKYKSSTQTVEEYWEFVESEVVRLGRTWNTRRKSLPRRPRSTIPYPDNVTRSTSESPASPGSPGSPGSPESVASPVTASNVTVPRDDKSEPT